MNKGTTKMIPGDELHLTMLMAPYSLNLVTGQDRQHLLAFGRAAFDAGKEAGQATPCLHQISEPEVWPCVNIDVDESGAITSAKLYTPGLPAGNHDVYPVRVPYIDEHTEAWMTCVRELEKFDPTFMNRDGMNGIECAAAAIQDIISRAQNAAAPQAVQATEEMRVCNNDECGWLGPLSETYGYKNAAATLCPECKETTELAVPAHPAEGVPAAQATGPLSDGLLPENLPGPALQAAIESLTLPRDGTVGRILAIYAAIRGSLLAATQPAAQGMEALGAHEHQERSA